MQQLVGYAGDGTYTRYGDWSPHDVDLHQESLLELSYDAWPLVDFGEVQQVSMF